MRKILERENVKVICPELGVGFWGAGGEVVGIHEKDGEVYYEVILDVDYEEGHETTVKAEHVVPISMRTRNKETLIRPSKSDVRIREFQQKMLLEFAVEEGAPIEEVVRVESRLRDLFPGASPQSMNEFVEEVRAAVKAKESDSAQKK